MSGAVQLELLGDVGGVVGCGVDDGRRLLAAEFFAGIGLVRLGLGSGGVDVVWANDIDATKRCVYERNFGGSEFVLGDVCDVRGGEVPSVDVVTASFPCVDLSVAGRRGGLGGAGSGLFFEFVRVLGEMGDRKPAVVLLENVMGFVSSGGGSDLRLAVELLNGLGYVCDLLSVDARWFVPQSRPRLFVVGTLGRVGGPVSGMVGPVRPGVVASFVRGNRDLGLQELVVPVPPRFGGGLGDVVERLGVGDGRWWVGDRFSRFWGSVAEAHRVRLGVLGDLGGVWWRAGCRRTRGGVAVWEVRSDDLAGCLRPFRGGSSRQVVVRVSGGEVGVRWMTARECARLQGVPDGYDFSVVSESQALFGFGDAVCVPAVGWLAEHVLRPAVLAVGS